jgi:2-keto-4-pentenoate hydratase/2-oxohepta-3-ene-1,7-dioic acid hydratase in catechol pathway
MRIARIQHPGGDSAGLVSPEGDSVQILQPEVGVLDLLADPDRFRDLAGEERRIDSVRLLAPVVAATIRDFSVFEQHIEGTRMLGSSDAGVPDVWYRSPFCYFTNPHALTGPDDAIEVPPGCRELDLELEVAAVIGRAGRNLTPVEAGAHIAGYTIFNDWSARDLQREERGLGFGFCKGKDFANTLGPWIVTPDELERYRRDDRFDLELRARVNGRELGVDTLANMAWSFEQLVAYASRGTWVKPGDVLGSGTCGYGCLLEMWGRYGREQYPPLQPGDTVTLEVEGIGSLTNMIVAGSEPIPLPPARAARQKR